MVLGKTNGEQMPMQPCGEANEIARGCLYRIYLFKGWWCNRDILQPRDCPVLTNPDVQNPQDKSDDTPREQ